MNRCDELKEYDELYDELCRVLTEYETGEPEKDVYWYAQDFYEVLVKIQSNWEKLRY